MLRCSLLCLEELRLPEVSYLSCVLLGRPGQRGHQWKGKESLLQHVLLRQQLPQLPLRLRFSDRGGFSWMTRRNPAQQRQRPHRQLQKVCCSTVLLVVWSKKPSPFANV